MYRKVFEVESKQNYRAEQLSSFGSAMRMTGIRLVKEVYKTKKNGEKREDQWKRGPGNWKMQLRSKEKDGSNQVKYPTT